MRYSAEHKAETRQRLLKVAADAIRLSGPHQVGVADVMSQAGLTHGGFYAYFASKDELVAEAIGAMFEESRQRFTQATAGKEPAAGVLAYIRYYLSALHRDSLAKGCPVAALLSDAPRVTGPAREAFSVGTQGLKDLLSGLLEKLGQTSPRAEADVLLAEMTGALMLARAEPDQKRSDEILKRARDVLKQRYGLTSPQ